VLAASLVVLIGTSATALDTASSISLAFLFASSAAFSLSADARAVASSCSSRGGVALVFATAVELAATRPAATGAVAGAARGDGSGGALVRAARARAAASKSTAGACGTAMVTGAAAGGAATDLVDGPMEGEQGQMSAIVADSSCQFHNADVPE